MTKEQKENLFILIKSMSKSEKRQFKLYAGRVGQTNMQSFFISLICWIGPRRMMKKKF